MATKLFLRSTTDNAIGVYKDMLTTAGSGIVNRLTDTVASGTQVQFNTDGVAPVLEWISGRAPSGGFTLSGTMTFSIWAYESNMSANCGARARVFKRTLAGVETEVLGGPWNDGVEFGTSNAELTWTGTPTSTVFVEDDRIIVRFYLTNIGTMASGHICFLHWDSANASTGDSFFQINETVTFKAETNDQTLTPSLFTNSNTFHAPTVSAGAVTLTPGLFSNSNSFHAPTLTQIALPGLYSNDQAFYAPTVTPGAVTLSAGILTNTAAFHAATVSPGAVTVTPELFTNSNAFYAPTVAATQELTPALFTGTQAFYAATVAPGTTTLTPALFSNSPAFYAATVSPGAVDLTPVLFSNSPAYYAATVAPGAVDLTPALFSNSEAFYSATITQPGGGAQDLLPDLFGNDAIFFAAIVEQTAQTLHGRRTRGKRVLFPDEIDPQPEAETIAPRPVVIDLATPAKAVAEHRAQASELLARIATVKRDRKAKKAERDAQIAALQDEYNGLAALIAESQEAERAYVARLRDEDEFLLLAA